MEKFPSVRPARAPRFRLAACARCRGDAFLDLADNEWRCLQCGRPVTNEDSVYAVSNPRNDWRQARATAG